MKNCPLRPRRWWRWLRRSRGRRRLVLLGFVIAITWPAAGDSPPDALLVKGTLYLTRLRRGEGVKCDLPAAGNYKIESVPPSFSDASPRPSR
jgi:hypothetical protein